MTTAGVTGAMMGGVVAASAILKRNLLSVVMKGASRSSARPTTLAALAG